MKVQYFEPMSHKEIAEHFGLSRESIRQIEKKALRKLKNQGKLEKFLVLFEDRAENYGDIYI
jgi:DNA-directed RNA polymerase sigma subunit (sigma70/sigma32)